MPAVVGRDSELAALESFLDRLEEGPAAVLLEGAAGAGKTTLWDVTIERARARGLAVLEARPAQSETALSFSGVADLLEPVLDDVVDGLPAPQRRALGFALLLDEVEGSPPDQRAVAAAFLGALQELSESGPVLVAVDDVQWLDLASSAALVYAIRRLRRERVGALLVRRSAEAREVTAELARSLAGSTFTQLDVGPLDVSALHRVVTQHLGVSLSRPLLVRVHDISGGNPFYALELARAISDVPLLEPAAPLPVPETLRELVRGRIEALPSDSRRALLVAASLMSPRMGLVERVTGGSDELRLAVEAGIVHIGEDAIRFSHPLLAAAAYEEADPRERRGVHARLAALVEDPEERARHLALATEAPDAAVAGALERAVLRVRSRGASSAAAELLERAAQLTPPADEVRRWRRMADAGLYWFESGDGRRARFLFDEVIRIAPAGPERGLALARLARLRSYDDDVLEALVLSEQALAEAEGDPLVLAEGHEGAAACLVRLRERLDDLLRHAAAAVEARRLVEEGDVSEALSVRLLAEGFLGREEAPRTLAALLSAPELDERRRVLLQQPLFNAAVCWYWWDEAERARGAWERLLVSAREIGDESSSPYILTFLGQAEWLLGDFPAASRHVQDGLDACEQLGQNAVRAYLLAVRALVHACTGPPEAARRDGGEAVRLARATSIRSAEYLARSAMGLTSLLEGDAGAAAASLLPVIDHARANGLVEPGAIRFVPDAVEALVLASRVDEAEEILDWYEGNAVRLGRQSAIAATARARALLAAERGDLTRARAELGRALAAHEHKPFPFEQARTLLVLGALERRTMQRRSARATLEAALAGFDRIGAKPWADRTRSELRRIGGRAPATGALTPAEERVALLVAEGKTNREVAAALFLSERTVEGHLSKVFAKLGVRSRAELAHVIASGPIEGVGTVNTGDSPVSAPPPDP